MVEGIFLTVSEAQAEAMKNSRSVPNFAREILRQRSRQLKKTQQLAIIREELNPDELYDTGPATIDGLAGMDKTEKKVRKVVMDVVMAVVRYSEHHMNDLCIETVE